MLRSIVAGCSSVAAALVLAACAQSQSPPTVTAPATSAAATTASAPPPTATPVPAASSAPATPSANSSPPGPGGDVDAGVPAQYRACHADADCVAVPRAGCCHNGWKESVAASQKDAYEKAFACTITPRPMCPMYIVHDARVAKCDAQAHLCVLVQP